VTPVHGKGVDTGLAGVRPTHQVNHASKNRYKKHATHVKMILEVTLGCLACESGLEAVGLLLKAAAGRDGDGGTTSSECESSI
jgi:hypothetical protein